MAADQSDFDSFVKRQLQKAEDLQEGDSPAVQLQEWLTYLEKLYADIQTYLTEYLKKGAITVTFANMEMSEESIGTYTARGMTLHIGRETIQFLPVGTMLIGTKGRVDVVGRAGTTRLALINRTTTSARRMIKVTIRSAENPIQQEAEIAPEPIDWVWKIVTRPPSLAFTELNKESFLQMILEVSNA
jgi:hypothetical protein